MNARKERLILLALLVLLMGARPTMGSNTVTVPFRATGSPVSITLLPDGKVQVIAQGRATHVGRYMAFAEVANFPGEPPTWNGFITMFAANGDELHFQYSGVYTQVVPIREGEGTFEITGGVGRFEGASGEGAFTSHGNLTMFDGTINLPR